MATYYMGTGGSDSNSGHTWAERKLTLDGIENIPVKAGDKVYTDPIEISPKQLFGFLLGASFSEDTHV